jgi:hypothetical protein
MPITIAPFPSLANHDWEGCEWTVSDDDVLAQWIAWVAVGQSHHVAQILHSVGAGPSATNADAIKDAVKLLTQAGAAPDHRDGWMFQVMSWLATNCRTPGALTAPPHMIHAQKGLDGLEILVDPSGKVIAAVITEDKATINPRETVSKKVWPEIKEFEQGAGVNRMIQTATSILLEAQHPNASDAVKEIVWKNARRYRVTITTKRNSHASRKSLFKGYSTVAPGANERRRGEIFLKTDMRDWMKTLAEKAIIHAQAMITT